MFAFQDTQGPVGVAFTDRHGGTSGGPFASLNLSDATGDDPAAVRRNLDLVRDTLGGAATPPLVLLHQVHGAGVHVVGESPLHLCAETPAAPVADAVVTAVPGVVLVVRVADCVPVLLADQRAGVVAAAHAGRAGLVAGVVPAALSAMRALGAGRVRAWVGPHVCGSCYEVPEQLWAQVSAAVPEARARTSWGTPALDVGAGVVAQLSAEGADVVAVSRCTMEDDDFFSHRRQGARSGRAAGLVWRRT